MPTPDMTMDEQATHSYYYALRRIQDCFNEGKKGATLNLSDLGLTTVPAEIGQLEALKSLNLANNKLTSLPPEIGHLKALTELALYNNQLLSLPPEIGYLKALKKLNLSQNQLTSLPAEFSRLKALTTLSLSYNQLMRLTPEIGQLTALVDLRVHSNLLTSLPSEIGKLTALKTLTLSHNQLTSPPPEIGQLSKLEGLDLGHNQLLMLPKEMIQLKSLERLYLHENTSLGLPTEVLGGPYRQGSTPAKATEILEYYFRNRSAKVKRPILEAKVILLGWGAVGKTSLRHRLVDGSFHPDEGKTHKIEITPWPVQVGSEKVKLHVWDFGGQEIMHATHQFFLTKRSLYVLVLAGREKVQGAQEAEYWLRLIQSFGGGSPVLVVMNKQHECPFDLNRQSLMEKYPFIKGFVQTDCKPELNLDVLEKRILAEVDELPELRTEFDAKWMAIKDEVTDLKLKGRKRIAVTDYLKLCQEQKEEEEKWQRWLLGFLHDLGVVVCFHDDPRLANDGVLDPQWVVDGIYTVLNEPTLKGWDGQVTRAQIRQLLPVVDYSDDDLRVLLEMMEKFELCFPLHGSRTTLVVPELMTEQETEWKNIFPELAKCLRFELHYDFLPEGLVPRFIVATHDLSKAGERWRSGVILREGKNIALVRGDAVDCRVSIVVNEPEPTRRVLLSSIRREFTKIHRSISSLGVKEMVPVPGLDVPPLGYEDLLAAEEAGDKDWPVVTGGVRHKIPIATLLDGIEQKEKRKAEAKDRANSGPKSKTVIVEPGGHYHEHLKSMNQNTGTNYGNMGDGNTQSITNSFNSGLHGEELTKLFETLTVQLSPLKDEMKGKDIKILDELLAKLTEEAQKPKDEVNTSELAVTGKGLIEAAQTVGEIAAPVLTTVGLILKFLGVSLPS